MRNRIKYIFFVNKRHSKVYVLFAFLIFSLMGSAQALPSHEYQVKAVFLFNFTKFVIWPGISFQNSKDPFVIAIVGEDPFGSHIDETVAGEKVNGHPIVIRRYKSISEIKHCHILFIDKTEALNLKGNISEIPMGVLTVGEDSNFNTSGGMIRFITKDNKIKLMISLVAVKAADLNISSKVLSVADIFIR